MTRIWPVLAWIAAALPIAGWVAAQSMTSRIGEPSEFTAALIRTLATSTFAVILFLSATTNAIVITRRSITRPRTYRWAQLGAWQTVLLALQAAWLCVVLSSPATLAEFLIGVGIAGVSCVVFALASRRDPDAALRRAERVSALSPIVARRQRIAAIAISAALGSIALLGVVSLSVIPIDHHGCSVTGTGHVSGAFGSDYSVYTSCGDFVYDSKETFDEILGHASSPLTITTQGFQLLPPSLRLIAFQPER